MDFRYSQEEERFRGQVRDFIAKNMTPEVRADTVGGIVRGPASREFMVKMSKAGLLGLSWPKEWGGKGMSPIYDFLLNDELAYVGGPQTGKGVGIIGRTLMRHGNDYLKQYFLPKILNAELEFAIGYTEPDAGSDLASLKIRAKEDGDDFVISGQKMFCSSAHIGEWVWLLARTDPELPKHKGVSLFLIDMKTPGITVRGMNTLGDEATNEVFFDEVRVPKRFLVGERGAGFKYGMEALAYERHVMFPAGLIRDQFDRLLNWVKDAEIGGKKLAKDPLVRQTVARLATEMEVCNMHELRVVNATQRGQVGDIEAAMIKLFGSHLEQRIGSAAMDMMGPYGLLKHESPRAFAEGYFEHLYRFGVIRTVGGGSSEIQKNILAKRHLGLPA